jgi:hypothetical protein
MVLSGTLVSASNSDDAARVSKEHPDFNVIPIRREGLLTGYFERDGEVVKEISVDDLTSDGTSLIDLVEILEDRDFAFVLGERKIRGYVHYSDLNHSLIKLTFYVLCEAVERVAFNVITQAGGDACVRKKLDPVRLSQVEGSQSRSGDAARNLLSFLNIADMLRIGQALGRLSIEEHVVKEIKTVRDGAAHVSDEFITSKADVRRLNSVKRECLRILGSL